MSGVVQFGGANYDGPSGLDGPQGGMLDDSAASGRRGRRRPVDRVHDHPRRRSGERRKPGTLRQQQSFLDSLSTASRVMYSSHGSFGKPIPEPETITLVALGLAALALAGRARTPN